MTKSTAYVVTRRCCTSGNCTHCHKLSPLGQSVRVEQARYEDRKRAEQVAANWKQYDAKVEVLKP